MLNISFQNLSWLEEKEKEVVSALRYFKTIVDKMAIDKKVLEMLPGSASKVLEAILPLVQSDPRIQHRRVHARAQGRGALRPSAHRSPRLLLDLLSRSRSL